MKFGENLRNRLNSMKAAAFIAPAMLMAGPALAQEAESPAEAASVASGYTPLGPDMIKGQPVSPEDDFWGSMGTQTQFSPIGDTAMGLHTWLVWIMVIISILVALLLVWVMVRYNRRANPVPSKTSHNTLLEVLWTGIPVLILVVIAVPSIGLVAKQYESPPADAITVKATGYQWYWGYEYPDLGVGEIISNMMPDEDAVAAGLPPQLAVDNRLVLPVGVPIRMQTTAADVIHSFAVPSLWYKLDAVPGRLNEKQLIINEPGIYYGQCSELCGVRHGYMPISVEAVPMDQFRAWVALQGGSFPGDEPEAEEAPAEEAVAEEAEETTESAEAAPAA